MMSRDPRIDPDTANIVGHDTHQTYARRTVGGILGFVIAIILIAGFLGWFFFSPSDEQKQEYAQTTENVQMPGNEYSEGSGQSKTYNFFYKMFGGIEDGLEDNPHNLENVEHIDQLNIDTEELFSESASPQIALEKYYDRFENIDDGYRHSVYDVVGSDVVGAKGEQAGKVHDILVDKETGEAKAVIVDQDGGYYDRNLAKLRFKSIAKQGPDGDVRSTVTEGTIEDKKEFVYSNTNDRYLSLRNLRDGQVIDYEGNVAGQVDAIIYENAEVQRIFFALKSALSPTGREQVFGIPYDAVNVVENPDGYDVKLTKEQTEALAESLYR